MKLHTAATIVAFIGTVLGALLVMYARWLSMEEFNYINFLNIEAAFNSAAVVVTECAASALCFRFIKI